MIFRAGRRFGCLRYNSYDNELTTETEQGEFLIYFASCSSECVPPLPGLWFFSTRTQPLRAGLLNVAPTALVCVVDNDGLVGPAVWLTRHFIRPLRGLGGFGLAFPPLKRRAIVIRPALRDCSNRSVIVIRPALRDCSNRRVAVAAFTTGAGRLPCRCQGPKNCRHRA